MDYIKRYNEWLTDDYFDQQTKEELRAIADDDKEIKERFYKDLEFGTGGLRGIIGAGTNRMNAYTVAKATQGLANYILNQKDLDGRAMGVAIAYDSRNQSPEFAKRTALVLNGNGIKTYLFDELRPTPELSFAVRHLKCVAGIVITASHNPPEYNGYKAYWSDGGQVPYPRDNEIIDEVNKVERFSDILVSEEEYAKQNGLFNIIGKEIDDLFIENLKKMSMNKDVIEKCKDLRIVYTPLHGTGNKPVRRLLTEMGFENVHVVPQQEHPDCNFSTVGYPNPEDPNVFKLGIEIAEKISADIIMATDPDADRLGVMVKDSRGKYVILTGNMTGALLTHYILEQRRLSNNLPENGVVIKTIVTSEMVRPIANDFGVEVMDVLTGFKYIGEKIKEFEQNGDRTYLFGFEESYGSLPGTYARDKDAVVATLLIAELCAKLKLEGKTLYDGLTELYEKYGFFKEDVKSITLKGIEGVEKIKHIMKTLRETKIDSVAGRKVLVKSDYLLQKNYDFVNSKEEEILLPQSDVLRYTLESDAWACVRPSGTEPKIKIYFGVKGDSFESAEKAYNDVSSDVMSIINGI